MDNRTKVGWFITIAVVLAVLTVVWFRWGDIPGMKLNAWGDFLAGIAASLALLWVVVGYYQQRQELELQRKEVARLADSSVEQAEALARQAEAVEKSVQMTKEIEERAARPQLFWWGESSGGGDVQKVQIKNRGGEVYNLELYSKEGSHTMSLHASTVWQTDTVCTLSVKEKPISRSQVEPFQFPIRFAICATDKLGYRHKMAFEFPGTFSELKAVSHTWEEPTSGN